MNSAQELQDKLHSLGERYLRRTHSEMTQLDACLLQMRQGEDGARKEMERLMHKIRGSGAMFGFDDVSDCAGAAEQLCVSAGDDRQIVAGLAKCVADLRAHLDEAARTRNISLQQGPSSPSD
jgi:chemotaxis protein histidine kinase CheA